MKFEWLDKTEYPFTPHYFEVNGQRLHFIDEGKGETILFVHGTPSWSFDFRNVIKVLKDHYRCVAIDHMGFGLSDKPESYDYSTQRHSLTLTQFILQKDLNNLTLVVHDFGGPIGFDFAIQHPQRVKRIVILNSWLWDSSDDPDFKRLSKTLRSPLLPFLYRYFNFSPQFILPRTFGEKSLSSSIHAHYTHPFASRKERNGTLAFAKSLLNDQEWFESLWEKKSILGKIPVLLIWGMKDPVIRPHYLEKFKSGFSECTVYELPSVGHFPQEESPEEVAQAIDEFMRKDAP